MTDTLFTGAPLDATLFDDFITRLRHDCIGEGVQDHCTADVIFLVEVKEHIYGIDTEFAPHLAIYSEGDYYHSVAEIMSCHREHLIENLDALCLKFHEKPFDEIGEDEQFVAIGEMENFEVIGYQENWKLVNSHFTQSSADEFVRKHGHKYGGKLRISQESQHRSFEFNAIKNALLDGKLVWKG
jgi:hypothetical protein